MPREHLKDWNPDTRRDLAELILRWLQTNQARQVISNHDMSIHLSSGYEFFEWHRRILRILEHFLRTNNENLPDWTALLNARQRGPVGTGSDGGKYRMAPSFDTAALSSDPRITRAWQGQAAVSAPVNTGRRVRRFERLPKWEPWDTIPLEFIDDQPFHPRSMMGDGDGMQGPLQSPADPENIREKFAMWMPDVIGGWEDVNWMGLCLEWGLGWVFEGIPAMLHKNSHSIGPHFYVHNACHGVMADPMLMTAPTAPIFWPWHAFIDDLYEAWRGTGHSISLGFWSRGPDTWLLNGIVPHCVGRPLEFARKMINYVGLIVGEENQLEGRVPFVRCQRPLAGTPLPPGLGTVDLSGTDSFPAALIVPECFGFPLVYARSFINHAGLRRGWEVDFHSDQQLVARQRPDPGEVLQHATDQVHLAGLSNSKFPDEV